LGSRFFTSLTFLLILSLSINSYPVFAEVKSIDNVQLVHSSERTRIIFDVSDNLTYRSFVLSKPWRLVVDFDNAKFKASTPQIKADNKHLAKIRTGSPSKNKLRFVFELTKQLSTQSSVLKPNDSFGHRIVVDLNDLAPKTSQTKEVSLAEQHVPKKVISTSGPRKLIVAIDAGHGGADPGAIGYRGTNEKQLTLTIAKKLKAVVDQNPNMSAVLIRTGDYFIDLHRRRLQARDLNADVFLSIHADAFTKQSARGFSVFALSQRGATSAMARALAAKENAADLIGGVSLADKDQVLAQVLVDLSMTNTISESVNLGGRVLKELSKLGKLHSKRVEQAGFAVLKSPDMPSILIETGFITNPEEEKNLRSAAYQTKLVNAIYTAINEYYQQTPHFTKSTYASPSVKSSSSTQTKKVSKPKVHVVARGDSLSKISAKYNVTINALKRLNKLKRDTVYLGQKIKLPAGTKTISVKPSFHKVKRGDTLSEIAVKYKVSVKQIMKSNKLRSKTIKLGQRLKIPN